MNSLTDCEQLHVKHVDDIELITEIKTEPPDIKYCIKPEGEEFEHVFVKTEIASVTSVPEDMKCEMIPKIEKFEYTVIKNEVDTESYDVSSSETMSEVGATNKSLDMFLENDKPQFEQIKAEEDMVNIPEIPLICEIEETNVEESKCNLHACDLTEDNFHQYSEYKNPFVEPNNIITGMYNEKRVFSDIRWKPFPCSSCGKSFATKSRLSRHEHIHTGERPFMCNICCKSFCQKSNLYSHMRTHRGERPFICTVCSKSFAHKRNLKAHTLIHTSEKNFMCDICGKLFSYKHDMTIHSRIHTGEKPYTCSVCSKSFSHRQYLKAHIHVHVGHKLFTCNLCSKTFSDKSNLTSHVCVHNGNNHNN